MKNVFIAVILLAYSSAQGLAQSDGFLKPACMTENAVVLEYQVEEVFFQSFFKRAHGDYSFRMNWMVVRSFECQDSAFAIRLDFHEDYYIHYRYVPMTYAAEFVVQFRKFLTAHKNLAANRELRMVLDNNVVIGADNEAFIYIEDQNRIGSDKIQIYKTAIPDIVSGLNQLEYQLKKHGFWK